MKIKVGDIVRVKTYDELEESADGGDWDWPYTYSQGVKGIIRKIENKKSTVDNTFHKRYYLKFSFEEMFETNPAYEDDEEQMEYIFKENQEVPLEECELILKKNTKIIDLE
jgi:hypothetical protein